MFDGIFMMNLLQIWHWVWWRQKFENQSAFANNTCKNKVSL